jgi:hypothetical protein
VAPNTIGADFPVRRHTAVNEIIPPQGGRIERKVLRRVKAFRCSKWCVAFCVLATVAFTVRAQLDASFSIWLQLVGLGACGLALVAAVAAVVYRVIETPKWVTVRGPWDWPPDPPVIHLNHKD